MTVAWRWRVLASCFFCSIFFSLFSCRQRKCRWNERTFTEGTTSIQVVNTCVAATPLHGLVELHKDIQTALFAVKKEKNSTRKWKWRHSRYPLPGNDVVDTRSWSRSIELSTISQILLRSLPLLFPNALKALIIIIISIFTYPTALRFWKTKSKSRKVF